MSEPATRDRFWLSDHTFTVPLDHADPDGPTIEVYGREVRRDREERPWLLYLNGGPGFSSPRPLGGEGWLRRALADYRVLLLDQRGTGRSTPVTRNTLARLGSPARQAEYLTRFRADSIVRDAELVRKALSVDQWSVLGQSFGGYCAVTYLSFAPEGLKEVLITGGVPGLGVTADDVYRRLFATVVDRNAAHYERFPEDVDRARRVVDHLRANDIRLPSGRALTTTTFQSLGSQLGSETGSTRLHYLLESPFDGPDLSDAFLVEVERELGWTATYPLYSVLHEASYADGPGATAWSGSRIRAEFTGFGVDDPGPPLFTGEVIDPAVFDTDPALVPFREAAHLLARKDDWPPLYDAAQLRANRVPVAAAVYRDDMYVDRELSLETARTIAGARPWLTAEWGHDGLRASNGAVLDRLIGLVVKPAGGPGPAG
ncbi:alpha/beta fold hydrolase [Actinokineospora auranticolor]|uniref:Alpha/beta hydrolase family protein n=1 Tax=Actinokineospora auranticolor TaxID=155976 RepID=A0A2S6GNR0_9PSEU|nr:alpha/beta fold hydrolase [Actinokineospora auranticolor]PPK66816.1 alpha/beta hydrolase family protein [Actinokineospora auranticolor]